MKLRSTIIVIPTIFLIGLVIIQNFVFVGKIQTPQPGKFSAEKAFQHLENISKEPRRMYQPYYNSARDYIIDQLQKLDIEVELQKTTSLEPTNPIFYSGVENVIAKIEGNSAGNDAILLVAHLDSEPFVSPGASDNAASCATLLEIARALKSSEGLTNDLILLFSAPEESGLQGVTGFISEHPMAENVMFAMNFDGLGCGKLSLRAISSDENKIINELVKASPDLSAYSYLTSFDPYPPTDFKSFKLAGYPCIDLFTLIPGARLFHSKYDDISVVSPSFLQQNGKQILKLVNHFGNINLRDSNQEQAVFFNILNIIIVHYRKGLVIPFACLVLALSSFIIFLAIKKRIFNIRGVVLFLSLLVIGCATTICLIKIIWYLITIAHPMYSFLFNGASYNRPFFFLGFMLLSFIVTFLIVALNFKRIRIATNELSFGVLIFLNLVAVGASFVFIDTVALLTWVILFLNILIITRYFTVSTVLKIISEVLYLFVTIILIVPLIIIQYSADDGVLIKYFSSIVFSVSVLPAFNDITLKKKKVILSIMGLASLFLLIIPLFDSFKDRKPRITYVSCISDADSGKSLWYTRALYKTGLDEYSKQFIKKGQTLEPIRKYFPGYLYNFDGYFSEIENVVLAAPEVEVISDSVSAGIRHLELGIKSTRDAWEITIFKDPDLMVIDYSVDGVKCQPLFGVEYSNNDNNLLCFFRNPGKDGITLSLKVKNGEKIALKVRDRTFGIPLSPGIKPMSDYMIPWVDYGAITTSVIKTYLF